MLADPNVMLPLIRWGAGGPFGVEGVAFRDLRNLTTSCGAISVAARDKCNVLNSGRSQVPVPEGSAND